MLSLFIIYKNIHKHIEIPTKYVIPSLNSSSRLENEALVDHILIKTSDTENNLHQKQYFKSIMHWPLKYQSFPMGRFIHSVRSNTTCDIRINNDVRSLILRLSSVADLKLEVTILTLQTYNHIYGDVHVPSTYIVPWQDAGWPPVCWGYPLGNVLAKLRKQRSQNATVITRQSTKKRKSKKEVQTLDFSVLDTERRWLLEMGLNWDEKGSKRELLQQLLRTYESIHNTTKIPADFVIPSALPWPESCWSMKLGKVVHNIRNGKGLYYGANVTEILPPSFHKISREKSFLRVYKALLVHQQLFGDLLVPRYFVVPRKDPWPEETWGMRLGINVQNIRSKTSYNHPTFHQLLLDIGFDMSLRDAKASMRYLNSESVF